MNDWAEQLLWTTYGYAVLAAFCILALLGLYTFFPGLRQRLLPLSRVGPVRWTGFDVLVAFIVSQGIPYLILLGLFGLGFFQALIGPAPDRENAKPEFEAYANRCMNLASPLVLVVVLVVLFTFLFIRHQARPHHYALSWARWPANLALAFFAFIIVTPLVYAANVLITLVFSSTDHALAQLGKQNIEGWEWILLAFQAGVAAPLLEEIVFRGILLGWLKYTTLRGHLVVGVMTVYLAISTAKDDVSTYFWPVLFSICLAGGYAYLLVRMVKRFGLRENEIRAWRFEPSDDPADDDTKRARLWAEANADLAIVGSAMLFATAHSGNWPAPIPLMLLALTLGWLARRTQSLIGPITLHALFNLVAFIALYGMVFHAAPENGNAQTTPIRPSLATTSVPASQLPLRK